MSPRSIPALLLAVLLAGGLLVAVPAEGAPRGADFDHLDPGGPASFREDVPVSVVFAGYDRTDVPAKQVQAELAGGYRPVVQSRAWYGLTEKLGINYRYDYQFRYASARWEDRLFAELTRLAEPAPLTDEQRLYNRQDNNVRVVGRNSYIDAPSVEAWLAENPPPGVSTRRNTVYYLNWFGRQDFRPHVYTKTDEPDPDTGYNFGVERSSRKIIAWGGTTANDEENGLGRTSRVWFHDLSAGPESWTSNWNVDDPDLDGNGVEDYRMPPTWEYTADGYRAKSRLAGDLGKITRYVALDLLMTTSPIYPVDIEAPDLPTSINLDSNTYEGWTGVDASERYIKRPLVVNELGELRPRDNLSYDTQDLPYDGKGERCYVQFLANVSCYPLLDYPAFANLFLFNATHLDRALDDRQTVDYELPIFNYSVGQDVEPPLLGFADDNYRDGTQTFVFNFVSPGIVEAGYGLSTTMIHEVGHHVGLSHPHDGYDSASGTYFGPADEFYFAWAGDESNSIMSYIDLNWDFSQFDRDNMARFLAAGYTENANRIAAAVLADPDAAEAADELAAADRLVGRSVRLFAEHSYKPAAKASIAAYRQVVAAADAVGVPAAPEAEPRRTELRGARPGNEPPRDEEIIVDTLDPSTSPRSRD